MDFQRHGIVIIGRYYTRVSTEPSEKTRSWPQWAADNAGNLVSLSAATRLVAIPRWDLQLGGELIGTINLMLMGKEKIAESLDKNGPGFGNSLAALGVAACIVFGGGELAAMAQDGTLTDISNPGWIKVAANAGPYLAASLLDFKPAASKIMSVAEKLQSSVSPQALQQALLALGGGMLSVYGMLAGNSASTIGATLAAGNLINLYQMQRSSTQSQQRT